MLSLIVHFNPQNKLKTTLVLVYYVLSATSDALTIQAKMYSIECAAEEGTNTIVGNLN